jgi:STE24 endopeptidase
MLPITLLLAVLLAFGFQTEPDLASAPDWPGILCLMFLGLSLVAGGATFAGWLGERAKHRSGSLPWLSRRLLEHDELLVDILLLSVYAWFLFDLHWAGVVNLDLGLADAILVDEALILLPFLLGKLMTWWGFHRGESVGRSNLPVLVRQKSLKAKLWGQIRHSWAIPLPLLALFALGQDLARRWTPEWSQDGRYQLLAVGLLGIAILIVMPAMLRWFWSSEPLPRGPLRDRLIAVSERLGFRIAEIYVWETGGSFASAAVTGLLPKLRYVFLTDELLRRMQPDQIEAVFAHELGHVAHRHIVKFAAFFLGSLGVFVLMDVGLQQWILDPSRPWAGLELTARENLARLVVAVALTGYFALVFGMLARRFERQADLFGCRVLSCGKLECPPHEVTDSAGLVHPEEPLCPTGLRRFADTLKAVSRLNQVPLDHWSWRHGRMGDRIHFLEGLVGRPDRQTNARLGLLRYQLSLMVVLGIALIVAVVTGAFQRLN